MKPYTSLIIAAFIALAVALYYWALARFTSSPPIRRRVIGNINRSFYRRHLRKFYLAPLLIQRVLSFFPGQPIARGGVQFANIGEGTFTNGIRSYLPDATGTARYLMYKIGTDGDHVAVAGAGDVPLGPSDDSADSTSTSIAVNLLGVMPGLMRGVTDGSIANGDHVKCGAAGVIVKAATTDISFGIAIFGTDTSSAAGDVITFAHCVPHKYVF